MPLCSCNVNREAHVNEIQSVTQTFGPAPSALMDLTQQFSQKKNAVKVEEYRAAVANAIKSDSDANAKIMEEAKLTTLDRKTKDWVLKEFTRTRGFSSSSSFSASNAKVVVGCS